MNLIGTHAYPHLVAPIRNVEMLEVLLRVLVYQII
jgi:hypothetical protein